MTMYRITIEKEKPKDEKGYVGWDDIYRQTINDLEVSKIINMVNEPRPIQYAQPGSIIPVKRP